MDNNIKNIFSMIENTTDLNIIQTHIKDTINNIIKNNQLKEIYSFVFLYDPEHSISEFHSNIIYKHILKLSKEKDILMFIDSGGGRIEPAYLISKTCKKHSKNKFISTIPRKAKSAATLICLGTDEIHMGDLSELGPIDPQFEGGIAAQSISDALRTISQIISENPASTHMFANYLSNSLQVSHLGMYERINQSATQYAEILLKDKNYIDYKEVAYHFTNHYKDHSFVIDYTEAISILKDNMIKIGTEEYNISNQIYDTLDTINYFLSKKLNKKFRIIGILEENCFYFYDDN